MPVNEVYVKASSELMKNSDAGIHIEQLDSLTGEQTRRAQGLAKGLRAEGNSGLASPLLRSVLVSLLCWEELGMLPACTSPTMREKKPLDWAVGALLLRGCSKRSLWQVVTFPSFLRYCH